MARLTAQQVVKLALDAGLTSNQAIIATAIAKLESGYRTDARGPKDSAGNVPTGLWQVKVPLHGSSADALTSKGNARMMVRVSGGGSNWCPWEVFYRNTPANCPGRPKLKAATGRWKAAIREATNAWSKVAGPESPGIMTGRFEGVLPDPIGAVFEGIQKWVLPSLMVAAGAVLIVAALGGLLAVAALARGSREAVRGTGLAPIRLGRLVGPQARLARIETREARTQARGAIKGALSERREEGRTMRAQVRRSRAQEAARGRSLPGIPRRRRRRRAS